MNAFSVVYEQGGNAVQRLTNTDKPQLIAVAEILFLLRGNEVADESAAKQDPIQSLCMTEVIQNIPLILEFQVRTELVALKADQVYIPAQRLGLSRFPDGRPQLFRHPGREESDGWSFLPRMHKRQSAI